MITQETYNGSAQYSTADVILSWKSPRITTVNSGSARNVTLPSESSADKSLGKQFYVVNRGAGIVTVQTSSFSSVKTLATNKVGVFVATSSIGLVSWKYREFTLNTSRQLHHGTRSYPAADTDPATYDPYCASGDDCDLAAEEGNAPLDGTGGNPVVVAPFFEDIGSLSKNATREPIRATDLVMPKVIPVGFVKDAFNPDPSHPLYGSYTLSDEFFVKLYNSEHAHALVYEGSHPGVSRHWHHARYVGAAPGPYSWRVGTGLASLSVKRHVWSKTITYSVRGTSYSLEIRLVMEHMVNPEPKTIPNTGGGSNDPDNGAWGAIFSVYVFSTEVNPSWVDGSTFTPAGATGPITFTRNDPAVWGAAYGIGMSGTKRFCHPQMVVCAHVPTTFEAPIGSNWVPVLERAMLNDGLKGQNREYCYLVSNPAPWIPGPCTDPCPAGPREVGNIVFGENGSVTNAAAMTPGGSPSLSLPPGFLVIENANQDGMTFLYPAKAGWDDRCGKLTVADGSSMWISWCVDWDPYVLSPCVGHKDEPFGGYGGSHVCFHNNGVSTGTRCCISTVDVVATATDCCYSECVTYDAFGTIVDARCKTGSMLSQNITLKYEDSTMWSSAGRVISWKGYVLDPDATYYNYVYDSGSVGDFSNQAGTWSYSASYLSSASVEASSPRAVVKYSPAGNSYRDYLITVKFQTATTKHQGVFIRGTDNGTTPDGYSCVIIPTGGTNATVKIRKHIGSTITDLVTKNITNLQDSVDVEVEAWGADIDFRWIANGPQDSLSVSDCTYLDGWPGLISEATISGARYAEFSITDKSYQYVEISASLGQNEAHLSFPEKAHAAYGQCNSTTNSGCTTSCETCTDAQRLHTTADVAYTGHDIVLEIPPAYGDNPTYAGGPNPLSSRCNTLPCTGAKTACVECPPPFETLKLDLFTRCWEEGATEAKLCYGISRWNVAPIVCV